jgi:hypothetical protein
LSWTSDVDAEGATGEDAGLWVDLFR